MKSKSFPLIVIPILLSSCGSKFYDKVDHDFGIEKNISPYTINDTKSVNESNIFKFHGRYYFDSTTQAMFFNFSNSGFEVTFTGTTLEGYFLTTQADNDVNRPYLAVCIDNNYDPNKATPIQLTSTINSNSQGKENGYFKHQHIVLAHDLENKEHTIRIYKRSECQNSKIGIKSISSDGTINSVKPKDFSLKMEFFGDSVTCGYAVESPDYYERFSTRTENAMKTYANYAGNILNADVSLVSSGGFPMYKSKYSQGCNPDNVPALFSLADLGWGQTYCAPWDNTKYIPDVVVIALGANDGSILQTYQKGSSQYNDFLAHYKSSYISFLDTIYNAYPSTLVVISDEILPIDTAFTNIMDDIVTEYNLEHSPEKPIIRAKYNAYKDAKDRMLPGEGHPNHEMQKLAGQELATLISNTLGK